MAESKVVAAYIEAPEQPALPTAGVAAVGGVAPDATEAAPPQGPPSGEQLDSLLLTSDAPGAAAVAAAGGELPPGQRRPRVLLAVSGSVATIKVVSLAEALLRVADVRVVATKSSLHFFDASHLPAACQPVLRDDDEWRQWGQVGDPVIHIELRRWADALVIAPLSANTLAKVANGQCDNLLTCVVRAWDFGKPLLVAPAMNTFMWKSPFTAQHLGECEQLGVRTVPPVSKRLACGDIGEGGMASVDEIAARCGAALEEAGFQFDAATALPAAGDAY